MYRSEVCFDAFANFFGQASSLDVGDCLLVDEWGRYPLSNFVIGADTMSM
jgi:hypothetical protein